MKKSENPFQFKNAEDSSGFLLWQVTNLWQRKIKKALEPFNLTHSQFVLMASMHWLSIQKQELTQIVLSNHTKIDPMTTSTVLRTLQTKGLVKRQEHEKDTRAKTVVLTDSGTELVKKAVVVVEKFDNDFFSLLNEHLYDFNKNLELLLNNKDFNG